MNASYSTVPEMAQPESTHFLYTVIENLGLCVVLGKDLHDFLNKVFYVQIALCTVGILGSAVAVAACVKRKLRSSCSAQLALLSMYDVFFLLASLLMSVLGLYDVWDSPATKVFLYVRTLALWGATYSTLDICLERCLSVARPFLAHSRFTVSLALRKGLLIALLGLTFTVPLLLDLVHGYSVGDQCQGQRQLTTFGLVYTLYLSLLLLYILPYSAIVVINIFFAVTLCRLCRKSVQPKRKQRSTEEQVSALVVSLSVWYVASMLLPSVLFLIRLTRLELFQPEVDIRVAAVADTVVVLSCCSNFIFYFLLCKPFRQVAWGWVTDGWRMVCGRYESLKDMVRTYTTTTSITTNSGTPLVTQGSASSDSKGKCIVYLDEPIPDACAGSDEKA